MSKPAIRLIVSEATKEVLLGVAYENLPGLSLAKSIHSLSVFAGSFLFTTSTKGSSPTRAIGVKSLIGSYLRLTTKLGLAECDVLVVINRV